MNRTLALATLLSSLSASAAVTVSFVAPINGGFVDDAYEVQVLVQSQYEVTSATATLGTAAPCALVRLADGEWRGACSAVGVSFGGAMLSVTAVNARNETGTVAQTVLVNRLPLVELIDLSRIQTMRPSGRIHARCSDDGSAACRLKLSVTTGSTSRPVLVFDRAGGDELDVSFDYCDPGTLLHFDVTATDGVTGLTRTLSGALNTETSSNLRTVARVPGRLLDFDGTRVLMAGNDGSVVVAALADGGVGAPTTLGRTDTLCSPPFPCVDDGWLTSGGALWLGGEQAHLSTGATAPAYPWPSNTQPTVRAGDVLGSAAIGVLDTRSGALRPFAVNAVREVAVLADGRHAYFTQGNELRLDALDGGSQLLLDGSQLAFNVSLTPSGRVGYRMLGDAGVRMNLHVVDPATPGATTTVEDVSTPYVLTDAWLAFMRGEPETAAVYLRDGDGGEQRLTFWNGRTNLLGVSPTGVVAYDYAGTRHVVGPSQPDLMVGDGYGARPLLVNGDWYVLEGDTLFAVAADAGLPACVPFDAGTFSEDAGSGGPDGGASDAPYLGHDCGCSSGPGLMALAGLIGLVLRRRR